MDANANLDPEGRLKTFKLDSPRHYLEKLEWECEVFTELEDGGDLRARFAAFNACATAWQMTEWLWDALDGHRRAEFGWRTKENMFTDQKARCPELRLCQQVGNAGKHFVLLHNDPLVTTDVKSEILIRIDPLGRANLRHGRERLYIRRGERLHRVQKVLFEASQFWAAELTRLRLPALTA